MICYIIYLIIFPKQKVPNIWPQSAQLDVPLWRRKGGRPQNQGVAAVQGTSVVKSLVGPGPRRGGVFAVLTSELADGLKSDPRWSSM